MLDDAQPGQAAEHDRGPTPPRPRRTLGLAGRLLVLTVGFVMVAEAAIYIPSIAAYRDSWLRDRLAAARTAALVFQAAPNGMIPERLRMEILGSVEARIIVLKEQGKRRLLAVSDMPPKVDETYDLRDPYVWDSVAAAFRALLAPPGRMLTVLGPSPMGPGMLEITLDETPLGQAMRAYSVSILVTALLMSGVVAGLGAAALNWLVLRPMRRLTSNIIAFGENPEDPGRIGAASGRSDEVGRAETALRTMQSALTHELAQKKRLAALGLAVAKINHDLRNLLSSAQLLSDRLSGLADPIAQRLGPKLIGTLDRAISFCQATLAYGQAVEPPPNKAAFLLRPVAIDAAETAVLPGLSQVELEIQIPPDLQIFADADQIFRVLNNLSRNAADAMHDWAPEGGGPRKIGLRAAVEGAAVVIEVADNGPGVAPGARARLFEAFRGSTRAGGTGLGLAIAADLVRAHGGSIGLVDTAAGATFRIELPHARQSASQAGKAPRV